MTKKKQDKDKRNTNVFVTMDGEKMTVSEWCRKYKIPTPVVYERRRQGWSWPEAIKTKRRPYNRHTGPETEPAD